MFPAKYEIFRSSVTLLIISCQLLFLDVEKIIGWAISYHFMHSSETSTKESKPVISAERLFSSSLIIFLMWNVNHNKLSKNNKMKFSKFLLTLFYFSIVQYSLWLQHSTGYSKWEQERKKVIEGNLT
jgi:hypothetical protein